MWHIYQINKQEEIINSFYNELNHKTFRKLFFDTIYSVINLFIKQPDDAISSKNIQAFEYQSKDKLEHKKSTIR